MSIEIRNLNDAPLKPFPTNTTSSTLIIRDPHLSIQTGSKHHCILAVACCSKRGWLVNVELMVQRTMAWAKGKVATTSLILIGLNVVSADKATVSVYKDVNVKTDIVPRGGVSLASINDHDAWVQKDLEFANVARHYFPAFLTGTSGWQDPFPTPIGRMRRGSFDHGFPKNGALWDNVNASGSQTTKYEGMFSMVGVELMPKRARTIIKVARCVIIIQDCRKRPEEVSTNMILKTGQYRFFAYFEWISSGFVGRMPIHQICPAFRNQQTSQVEVQPTHQLQIDISPTLRTVMIDRINKVTERMSLSATERFKPTRHC
ncbi:hypothetical protein PM082_013703 [Marasmius tenuissimus]|nr:hypothetical protein PM082_013703 [Marasmius tenuissimus]